jgi:hypothetical protein
LRPPRYIHQNRGARKARPMDVARFEDLSDGGRRLSVESEGSGA